MMTKYYVWIVLTLFIFWAGWRSSYNYYAIKQLKLELIAAQNSIKNRDKIIALDQQSYNQKNLEALSYKTQVTSIENDLQTQLRINAYDKDYINKHNIITNDLMRRVGALTKSTVSMSKDTTIAGRVESSHGVVSAYQYSQWARGLKAHDEQCVAAFNSLQNIYNGQLQLINGFNND